MSIFRKIAVLVIGFVFFVAGSFKLMDPVGTRLIVGDYLRFFHLGFLGFAAPFIAEIVALGETLIGAALLTGVWKRLVAQVTAVVLGFFTIITLILLIFNPSMDCGCFGEVIHLSHFQSFAKNVVLDLLWCLAFLPLRPAGKGRAIKYVSFSVVGAYVLLFAVWSLVDIPLVDYTPFKPGVELDEESTDLSESLSFFDAEGEYCDSLALVGNVVIVSVYNPVRADWESIDACRKEAGDARFVVLVSGDPDEIGQKIAGTGIEGSVYYADRRKLMSFNRSNGGVTYLFNGQIVKKWGARFRPDKSDLEKLYDGNPIDQGITENSASRFCFQGFLLFTFAVMLLM